MDILFIHDLAVQTSIGVFEWEKKIKQKLLIDLEIAYDFSLAAKEDNLNYTLDYGEVACFIQEWAQQNKHQLLESFAENLIYHLLEKFKLTYIKIKLTKPAVLPMAKAVGIIIERGKRN